MKNLISKNQSVEERALWNRVNQLWKCSVDQDIQTIDKAIHPKYIGWDNNSLLPHDRNYGLQSVTDNSVRLVEYNLYPLGITVYEHQVGIANYRYRANISDRQKKHARYKRPVDRYLSLEKPRLDVDRSSWRTRTTEGRFYGQYLVTISKLLKHT